MGLRFDESSPQIMVDADKNRIMQVLSNFITNALKFTTKGSVTLSYRLEDDGLLHFCVTDTGKGIPAEQQHEIFSRFVKLDSFSQGARSWFVYMSEFSRTDGRTDWSKLP